MSTLATQQITPEDVEFIIETYRECPELYVTDVLGAKPWEMQVEIIKAIFKYKTVAVKTCNAVGKSFIAARIVVTFLTLNPGSVVVTTAPTWRQVTDVLWREIATTVKRALYKLTDAEVNQAGLNYDTDWYAVGLSTKYPENFFGYHADHILVVVDEAGGVPEPIFKGVKAITPNANARVLYIGNPTNPSGTFYEAFSNPRIKTFTISAFDTPNFKAVGIHTVEDLVAIMTPPEGVEAIDHNPFENTKWPYPALISPEVVYERYQEWGVDNPAWQSLVMGEFPTQADQSLIPVDLVMQAMNNTGVDPDSGLTYAELSGWSIPDGPPEYGLDMARYGSDSTVLTPRRGGRVDKQTSWPKNDLVKWAEAQLLPLIDPIDTAALIKIDDTGNGGGTTDALIYFKDNRNGAEPYQYRVVPYNFSSKDGMGEAELAKFHDITSFLYWNLRGWFFRHAISIPNDKQLFNELVGRRWRVNPSTGKIQVETKDEYKLRTGGKSPDKSDSLALAFAPDTSGSWHHDEKAHVPKVAADVKQVSHEDDEVQDEVLETGGLMDKQF